MTSNRRRRMGLTQERVGRSVYYIDVGLVLAEYRAGRRLPTNIAEMVNGPCLGQSIGPHPVSCEH